MPVLLSDLIGFVRAARDPDNAVEGNIVFELLTDFKNKWTIQSFKEV